MKVLCYSTRKDEIPFMEQAFADSGHQVKFIDSHLDITTVRLAEGVEAVCVFVNDQVDAQVIEALAECGVQLIALRCAGFNNVDLEAARSQGIAVVRVPAYSPYAVAEHTVGLILMLNRHLHKAYNRVREGNFVLDGLLGFDLHGKTVAVVGTGEIGAVFCRIMVGFGCRVVAVDPHQNADCLASGVQYMALDEALAQADIISLHCPLLPQTHHLIDDRTLSLMKPGVMLINTSRGALVDTAAVIGGLKRGHVGSFGIDVYEEEAALFFEDNSDRVITDDLLMRLTTFPNVVITGHQAFMTKEALENISDTTCANISAFESTGRADNQL
ncbi:MAG: 2-hydroxyacid dehydrogenase [Marinobacterium sp.]|nr:2-hydroxyacid dehydrogenase [Marinobacterium sp.]